jgi:G3E family GTPase
MVLRWLPVTHNKAVDAAAAAAAAEGDSPIKTVLRSKGFMWLSNKHTTAFYWSHAGAGSATTAALKAATGCQNPTLIDLRCTLLFMCWPILLLGVEDGRFDVI